MRRLLWVPWVVLAFSSCKREGADAAHAPAQAARPSSAAPGGEQAPAPGDEPAPGEYVVTQEKLGAYVGYQRKLLEAYEVLLRDMGKVQGKVQGKLDGGPLDDMAEVNATMKLIEGKAKAEEAARREAGLTEEDVNALAEVVTAVISQRQIVQALQFDEELKKLEEMQEKLTPEQREELAPQVVAMRERLEELQRLTEVRRTHGEANVDVVLSREADLAKNYQDMLDTFGRR